MGLHNISTTGRMAHRAQTILTKQDIERWRSRAERPLRFLLLSFLIGGSAFFIFFIVIGTAISIKEGRTNFVESVRLVITMGFFGLFGCGGLMVLPICGVLLSGGLKEYKKVMSHLRKEHRVCDVCACVSLYAGHYVYGNPKSEAKRNTLIPTLHRIKEAEDTHVLCDACLKTIEKQCLNRA